MFGERDCEDDPKTWGRPIVVRVVGVQLSPGGVRPPSGLYLQWVEVTSAFVLMGLSLARKAMMGGGAR